MVMIRTTINIQTIAINISKAKLKRYLKITRSLQKVKRKLIKMGNNISIEEA
jgi:hypothetical protein